MLDERTFKKRRGRLMGLGSEKEVYDLKRNRGNDWAVGVTFEYKKGEITERQAKGRLYLQKILHIFFPEHIIDIHQSSRAGTVTDKKDFVGDHKVVADYRTDRSAASEIDGNQMFKSLKALTALRDESGIEQKLRSIGVRMNDTASTNFGEDSEGNTLYCDTIDPWFIKRTGAKAEVTVHFNQEKLAQAIDEFPDEKKKRRMLSHFKRLVLLFEEEIESLEKQYPRAVSVHGDRLI